MSTFEGHGNVDDWVTIKAETNYQDMDEVVPGTDRFGLGKHLQDSLKQGFTSHVFILRK